MTATEMTAVPAPAHPQGPAAHTVEAVKVFGRGDTAVRALDGVSVDFAAAQFTAIMGPSGSGKSTLMHCVAGLDPLTQGQTWIGDVQLSLLSEKQLTLLRREKVGFIFQSFNLVATLNARDNITLPLQIAGRVVDKDMFDLVVGIMGLKDRLGHRPHELSGGQQQRVAAARALVSRPAIVFADEPTGNLDSTAGAELLGFLRRAVGDFGQTIVMVTHDPNAACFADRVIFLADGRVREELLQPTTERVLGVMQSLHG